MNDERVRQRQGPVRIRHGIPYPNRDSTLSLLPNAVIGEWLAANSDVFAGRLLDVGCGNRPYAGWYRPRVRSAVAVDAAPLEGLDVLALAGRLPFRDASFDVVLSTSVLEHVEDPATAVQEWFRVLRSGGHLVIEAPYLYPTHEAPYDFTRFTPYGLEKVLTRAGFDVIRLNAEGGAVLLGAHLATLVIVQVLDTIGRRLFGRPLTAFRPVRALLWAPQELAIALRHRLWRRHPSASRRVSGLAARASLGNLAIARRPDV